MAEPNANGVCAECGEEIDCCELCNEQDCDKRICYFCLAVSLGQILPHPHAHGG